MVDSDNLKQMNDQFGHEAGNRMLQHLVKLVLQQLRSTDVAARYGGDEFVVMLPDTPARGAFEVAERIRNAVASAPFPTGTATVACSVSIGAASFPQDGRSMDALLARADRALYQAKEAGRNRVAQFHTPSATIPGAAAPDAQIQNPT
jgi:diguanylate cyclase (GGDEF)-like protein